MLTPKWLILPIFLVVWFFSLIFFELLGFIASKLLLIESNDPIQLDRMTISRFFQTAGTFFTVWLFTKYVDKVPFVSLGFQLKNRWKDILFGLFLGFAIMGFAYIFLINLNEIQLKGIVIDYASIAYSILFFLLVAFFEELLCRGYILTQLMSFMNNKYSALAISSVIFTALHSMNPNMAAIPVLNLFLAGILLGITYIYTKNLWFPIALHFSWNFFQGPVFGFEVSGQDFYTIIEQSRTKNTILNGGNFGFEGSLLATLLLILFIILIDRYYRKKTSFNSLNK